MMEIIKNYQDNKRFVYEEPPITIYDGEYYTKQCGGFETFLDSGGQELDDSRQRVLDLCKVDPSFSALDIGCGRGELVFALADLGLTYVEGIDLSEDAIHFAQQTCENKSFKGKVNVQLMSATQLEFADNTFDVAYMTDIVEHLSDENLKLAVSEAYRVLKPGGVLVIHTLPTVNFKLYGQYLMKYYMRLRGQDWWTPTSKEEISGGHINIHSRESLRDYLLCSFSPKTTKVFYGPVNPHSLLKKIASFFGIWVIMSSHLWATAVKESK
jgi:ubiquinone/menaquinone biosynthesis C-methylase UbiE